MMVHAVDICSEVDNDAVWGCFQRILLLDTHRLNQMRQELEITPG